MFMFTLRFFKDNEKETILFFIFTKLPKKIL